MIHKIIFCESSPHLGGQEIQMLRQMVKLKKRWIEVKLACRETSMIQEEAVKLDIETINVPFKNSIHFPSLSHIYRAIHEWRPDVVITHSGHDANVAGLASILSFPRPQVVRVKTYIAGSSRSLSYNLLADKVIVPSYFMKKFLLKNPRIKEENIYVVYPGISFDDFSANIGKPLPSKIDTWIKNHPGPIMVQVAMVRREKTGKGHLFMLQVMEKLIKQIPELRYIIVGDGEGMPILEEKIKELKLEENVFLAGRLLDVAPVMKRADILINPAFEEALGMSQIEALSLGTPVIASSTGGIPETIQNKRTGLLVDAGNLDQWIETITWAFTHYSEMRKMAEEGKKVVTQKFSMDTTIVDLLTVLNKDL